MTASISAFSADAVENAMKAPASGIAARQGAEGLFGTTNRK
jgi:hypothetical protein